MAPSVWISEWAADDEVGKPEGWNFWRRIRPPAGSLMSDRTLAAAHEFARYLRDTYHCSFVAVRSDEAIPPLPVDPDA